MVPLNAAFVAKRASTESSRLCGALRARISGGSKAAQRWQNDRPEGHEMIGVESGHRPQLPHLSDAVRSS